MERNTRNILLILIAVAFGLLLITITRIRWKNAHGGPQPEVLSAEPERVIGSHPRFRGDLDSKYILVEFGDYQCYPCGMADTMMKIKMEKYQHKLKCVFRNLPLSKIHPDAMSAAISVEAAGLQGKFWPMHDAIYADQGHLDTEHIKALAKRLGLDFPRFERDCATRAKKLVEDDIEDAKRIKVNATPTFILCHEQDKPIHLGSLNQIDRYLH